MRRIADAEERHLHALRPALRRRVLPVQVFDAAGTGTSSPGFTGAVALKVDGSGIAETGRVAHDPTDGYVPPITRSIVIGDQLLTVSDGGVLASALDGFARVGWLAFPQPAGSSSPGSPGPG